MSIDFFQPACMGYSDRKKFGLCDDPPPNQSPAYIDEEDGRKWIAVVVNDNRHKIAFTAIDNCTQIIREDGKSAKRCDGVLTFGGTNVIFVELKARGALGPQWVKDGEKQLRTSITYFEKEEIAETYTVKKAYVANSEHPKFKDSQMGRMAKFLKETGYVLRIENRIILD